MGSKLFRIITGFDLPTAKKPNPSAQKSATHRHNLALSHLMHQEAKVGGQLFGPVPRGHNREFFCLDTYTWVWFEEWFDERQGITKHINVQYDVKPQGILKTVDGIARGYVQGQELEHLLTAMDHYCRRIASEIYGYQLAAA